MNRSASLLFAFGVLLAHALVLCQDQLGHIARPPDGVNVAFRMARNLVRTDSAAFDATGPLLESYPSHLWIALSALADRFYLGPNQAAQGMSLLSALGIVLVVSRFSPARLAGVMAPLFVVVSGSVAAAALSGTEWTTFALLCVTGLLMLEEGRPRALTIVACLAVFARPEGILLVIALGALALASRARRRGVDEPVPGQASVGPLPFAIGFGVWLAVGFVRISMTGSFFAPVMLDALLPDATRFANGSYYLLDYFARSGAMLLTIVPAGFALVGGLSPRGRRALVLGLAWCLWVAWQGGDTAAMWQAMVPAVPFLAVAIQEALTELMDTEHPVVLRTAWALFLVGLAATLLVSRRPTDIGPLPFESLQRAWMHAPAMEARFDLRSGRMGLVQQIADDERRRCAAIFVRDNLETDATVGTLWPGAVGYLSGRRVEDLRGRATLGGRARLRGDFGSHRVDLVRTLSIRPDFVLPPEEVDDLIPQEVATRWLERFDRVGATSERVAALARVLERYELVTVPIPRHSAKPETTSTMPYGLLRHERLGSPTDLRMRVSNGQMLVEARHAGHRQIVDLLIETIDEAGERRFVHPAGNLVADVPAHARSGLLLHNSGNRWIRLCSVPFEAIGRRTQVRAALVAPESTPGSGTRFAERSARVEAHWPPRSR